MTDKIKALLQLSHDLGREDRQLAILDKRTLADDRLDQVLLDVRAGGAGRKPSLEALLHAWLLSLRDVNFIGHCHPLTVNSVLCLARASRSATPPASHPLLIAPHLGGAPFHRG